MTKRVTLLLKNVLHLITEIESLVCARSHWTLRCPSRIYTNKENLKLHELTVFLYKIQKNNIPAVVTEKLGTLSNITKNNVW